MGELFLFLIIFGFIFGLIGLAIANNKGLNGTAGFLLGAFLGPIGLIIVALLSSSQTPTTLNKRDGLTDFQGEKDLTNDTYKIWLVSKYGIEKNETLSSFICDEKIFPTIDQALFHANILEIEKEKYEIELEEYRRIDYEESHNKQMKNAKFSMKIIAIILIVFFVTKYFYGKYEEKNIIKNEENKLYIFKNNINEKIEPWGIKLDNHVIFDEIITPYYDDGTQPPDAPEILDHDDRKYLTNCDIAERNTYNLIKMNDTDLLTFSTKQYEIPIKYYRDNLLKNGYELKDEIKYGYMKSIIEGNEKIFGKNNSKIFLFVRKSNEFNGSYESIIIEMIKMASNYWDVSICHGFIKKEEIKF